MDAITTEPIAPAVCFSDEQARTYLDHLNATNRKRPPVRDLAVAWGWSKSSVDRFLRDKAGTEGVSQRCPTPHERRAMLINADKDFVDETGPELVDRMAAEGKIPPSQADASFPMKMTVDDVVDFSRGRMMRHRDAVEAAIDEADAEKEIMLVRPQKEISIIWREETGEWVLRQRNWPDQNAEILINEEAAKDFLDQLCDAFGVGSGP